jgi:hypothetical protein
MGDHLVPVQIEIDPFWAAAPFWATEQPAVVGSGCLEVMDRERKMERMLGHDRHGLVWLRNPL